MEMNKLCSCIVPCFNEEKVIPIYYDEMQKVMITAMWQMTHLWPMHMRLLTNTESSVRMR